MKTKKLLAGMLIIGVCFMINNYAITIKNNNIFGIQYWISKSWSDNYLWDQFHDKGSIYPGQSKVWTKNTGIWGEDDKPDKVFVEVESIITHATDDTGDLVKNESCELTVENAGFEKIKIHKGAGC